MIEPIIYSLILKSVNGWNINGVTIDDEIVNQGSSAVSLVNGNLTYGIAENGINPVQQIFSKIASTYNCTRAKIEFGGCLFITNTDFTESGIDISLQIPGMFLNQNNSSNYVTIGGITIANANVYNGNGVINYMAPLYVDNIRAISQITVQLYDALAGKVIDSDYCPSYSLTLLITPILN